MKGSAFQFGPHICAIEVNTLNADGFRIRLRNTWGVPSPQIALNAEGDTSRAVLDHAIDPIAALTHVPLRISLNEHRVVADTTPAQGQGKEKAAEFRQHGQLRVSVHFLTNSSCGRYPSNSIIRSALCTSAKTRSVRLPSALRSMSTCLGLGIRQCCMPPKPPSESW